MLKFLVKQGQLFHKSCSKYPLVSGSKKFKCHLEQRSLDRQPFSEKFWLEIEISRQLVKYFLVVVSLFFWKRSCIGLNSWSIHLKYSWKCPAVMLKMFSGLFLGSHFRERSCFGLNSWQCHHRRSWK